MIEDELVHWFKDDKGENHRSILRLETEHAKMNSDFPKDAVITFRIMNGIGTIGFRLSPDEALRLGTELLSIAKEQLTVKRKLWNSKDQT